MIFPNHFKKSIFMISSVREKNVQLVKNLLKKSSMKMNFQNLEIFPHFLKNIFKNPLSISNSTLQISFNIIEYTVHHLIFCTVHSGSADYICMYICDRTGRTSFMFVCVQTVLIMQVQVFFSFFNKKELFLTIVYKDNINIG